MNKEKRKPGRPRSAEADNAIVEATLDLLDPGGVEAVKIEEVARRAGVARTTVYRRFPSRSDLVLNACEDVVSRYLRVPDTGAVRSDVVELLTTLIHALTRRNDLAPLLLPACFRRLGEPLDSGACFPGPG